MSGERVVIITDAGEGTRFGLVVDELLGHQQVVIKSIEESMARPGIAVATILGNGRVAFILDVENYPIWRSTPHRKCHHHESGIARVELECLENGSP